MFVRTEYDTFHKKKYFGTYIFDCYHPLVEGIHLSALGETRVNATVENIQEAVQEARTVLESWRADANDEQ